MSSINSYLSSMASRYYLKNDSQETNNIDTSVETLLRNLKTYFGVSMKRAFVFGSYDRGTILPRKYDPESDVDIMVVFEKTEYEKSPETYRSWLKIFADKYYKDRYGSEVIRSYPTVTVKLNHIKYDLVPAKENTVWLTNFLYIPGNGGWISTDPKDIKDKLTEANVKYNYIVKPIVRLLKGWNANKNYPFESYDLEEQVIKRNFSGDNIQSGLFWAARYLECEPGDSQDKNNKLAQLQSNLTTVKTYLDSDNDIMAKHYLHKSFPI